MSYGAVFLVCVQGPDFQWVDNDALQKIRFEGGAIAFTLAQKRSFFGSKVIVDFSKPVCWFVVPIYRDNRVLAGAAPST